MAHQAGRGIAARRTQVHSDDINYNVKLCCRVIEASRGTYAAVNLDFQNTHEKNQNYQQEEKQCARN